VVKNAGDLPKASMTIRSEAPASACCVCSLLLLSSLRKVRFRTAELLSLPPCHRQCLPAAAVVTATTSAAPAMTDRAFPFSLVRSLLRLAWAPDYMVSGLQWRVRF
jgi:hypothetical protein